MQDIFNESNSGTGAPSMLMNDSSGMPNFSDYRYRVERFALGGSDEGDEASGLESLLTRSIHPDRNVVIVDRKDSISATTGIYTCIIIYMERIPHTQGDRNA